MSIIKKTSVIIVLLGVFVAANAFAQGRSSEGKGRRPQGPPPEAFTACENMQAGDSAEFVSPHGDTVTGICEEQDGQLVLRPDRPREGSEGGPRGRGEDSTMPE